MNTISRRTALLGLAGLGVATVAGCGRSGPQGGGAAPSPAPAVSSGKATGDITMWAMGAEGQKLPDLLKQFHADNPDANVKVTAIPWESAHDKFTSAIRPARHPIWRWSARPGWASSPTSAPWSPLRRT